MPSDAFGVSLGVGHIEKAAITATLEGTPFQIVQRGVHLSVSLVFFRLKNTEAVAGRLGWVERWPIHQKAAV